MGPKPKSNTSKSKISKKDDDKKSKSSKSKDKDKDKKTNKSMSKKSDTSKLSKKKDDKKILKEDKTISEINMEEQILPREELANNLTGHSYPHPQNEENPVNGHNNLVSYNNNNNNNINNNLPSLNCPGQNCEGCFQSPGYCFCNECNKIYCKICDDQLHVVPAYRTHERVNLETFNNFKFWCFHHKDQMLTMYCESCQEPICKLCQVQGPHNTTLHKITSIFVIYRKLLENAKAKINGPIKNKADKLEKMMMAIDGLLKENRAKADVFLKEINGEYESIIDKINKYDGEKKAILGYSSTEIQKDILEIQKILGYLDEQAVALDNNKDNLNNSYISNIKTSSGAGGLGGMFDTQKSNYISTSTNFNDINDYKKKQSHEEKSLEFLLQYKVLLSSIDKIISKPVSQMLSKEEENNLLIFPEELNENKIKLENFKKVKTLLKIKEDIIWNLLSCPYEENNIELEQIKVKTNKEVEKWQELTKEYAVQLQKYNLACAYCGCLLADKMNESCPLNEVEDSDVKNNLNDGFDNEPEITFIFQNYKFTKTLPNKSYMHNGRHFFSEVTNDYNEKIKKGEIFDPTNIIKQRKMRKLKESQEKAKGVQNQNVSSSNYVGTENKENNNGPNYDENALNELIRQSMAKRGSRAAIRPVLTNEWVTKVARDIEKNKINLYQVLSEYENRNEPGTINLKNIIVAFVKLQVILNDEDKDSLTKYIKLCGFPENKINIRQISYGFAKACQVTSFSPLAFDNGNEALVKSKGGNFRYGGQNSISGSQDFVGSIIKTQF